MTLLRISNEENGYNSEDLSYFVKEHGLAKSIPEILHGSVRDWENGGWPRYLGETLWNFKTASGLVYALVFGLYFVIVLSFDIGSTMRRGDGRGRTRYCLSMLKRTLVLDLILVLVAYRMYQHLLGTSWIESIETGVIFRRPFIGRLVKEGVENYDYDSNDMAPSPSLSLPSPQHHRLEPRLTTVPERMDILFSHRFDSKHIGYYRKFLDYHPGNAQLNTDITLKSAIYNSYAQIPDLFGHRVVYDIIDKVYQTGSRFLSQNDFGEWTVMDRWEAEEIVVKRLLWSERGVFAALDEELSFLISANDENIIHHGRGGSLRKIARENLLRWKMTFDQSLMAVGAITTSADTTGTRKVIQQNLIPQKVLSLSQFTLQSHAKWASPGSQSLATTTITLSKKGTLIQNRLLMDIGDKVWAHDGGEHTAWRHATLLHIIDEGVVLGVIGKKGRERRFITSHDLIHPYRPLTQGDSVEVFYPEEEEYIIGVIARAYPDRTYDILYWEEDDETEAFDYRIPDDRLDILFDSDIEDEE